jgi:aspartyl-tRNA(Asn)/glutamyl-tRNA(Gln) amidotransferase subunit A
LFGDRHKSLRACNNVGLFLQMITATELVEESLAAIAQHGERTNAFIRVDTEGARATARALDDERRRGIDRGPLHGVPISIKDLIDIAGQPTTAASRVRGGHVANRDATVVTRLREAGVVILGKTNLHEFALGPTNDASAWGPVRNPHDSTRVAGGSSGGSAAAVALGMGRASIGSDTGGSIRIPAGACGVVGLKPTTGEIPLDGVVPLSRTLDHLGPITRSVQDAAMLWAVMSGRPPRSIEPIEPQQRTLGLLGGYFTALLANEVRAAFDRAIESVRRAGIPVTDRAIDGTETIIPTYISISLPEAAHWHSETLDSRAADYQPSVRDRLETGRSIPAVDYLRARDTQTILRDQVDAALEGCGALVLPTLPIVAPAIGAAEVTFDGNPSVTLNVRAAMLRLTQLFNISGHPAISLPIPSSGLPVGLQLIGRRGATEELLAIALSCERALSDS